MFLTNSLKEVCKSHHLTLQENKKFNCWSWEDDCTPKTKVSIYMPTVVCLHTTFYKFTGQQFRTDIWRLETILKWGPLTLDMHQMKVSSSVQFYLLILFWCGFERAQNWMDSFYLIFDFICCLDLQDSLNLKDKWLYENYMCFKWGFFVYQLLWFWN